MTAIRCPEGGKVETAQQICCHDIFCLLRYGVFRQDEDELPRVYKNEVNQEPGEAGYCLQDMDLEIQRVARELYKAFNGLNEGFKEAKDQVVIDELSSHTDKTRQELIHPYKVEQYSFPSIIINFKIRQFTGGI